MFGLGKLFLGVWWVRASAYASLDPPCSLCATLVVLLLSFCAALVFLCYSWPSLLPLPFCATRSRIGSRILDPGSWIQDLRTQDPGSRIHGSQDPRTHAGQCCGWAGPGLARAQRTLHTFSRLQVMPGTTRLAWVCQTGLGLQVLHGTTRPAWNYKSSLGLQVLPVTTRQAPDRYTAQDGPRPGELSELLHGHIFETPNHKSGSRLQE